MLVTNIKDQSNLTYLLSHQIIQSLISLTYPFQLIKSLNLDFLEAFIQFLKSLAIQITNHNALFFINIVSIFIPHQQHSRNIPTSPYSGTQSDSTIIMSYSSGTPPGTSYSPYSKVYTNQYTY